MEDNSITCPSRSDSKVHDLSDTLGLLDHTLHLKKLKLKYSDDNTKKKVVKFYEKFPRCVRSIDEEGSTWEGKQWWGGGDSS